MTKYPHFSFYNSIAQLSINLVLNILLVPRYGIMGAAFTTFFSIAVVNLARLVEIRALLDLHPFSRLYLKPIAAGIVSSAAALSVRSFLGISSPVLLFMVFGGIFLAVVKALRLDPEEQYLIMLVKKYRLPSGNRQ